MRVHFVLPQLLPYYGMEKAAALLLRALADRGHEVSASVVSGGLPPAVADMAVELLMVDRTRLRLGRTVRGLRRCLTSLPEDTVIVACGLWAAAPVAAALVGTGRSYVAWEHSVLPARLRGDRRVAFLFRVVGMPLLRPRQVVAVSAGVGRTVAARWPGVPTSVIANIVETADVPPPPARRATADERVQLLTAGAFRASRNYACAINALRHLPDRFVLRMAGDGPQAAHLRALVERAGLTGRVEFVGRVPSVAPLLAESHLLVNSSFAETFGFGLVEAAEAGVPVATVNAAAVDEMVPRYVPGTMAADISPRALARAIEEATARAPTEAEITRAWRCRVRDFSPRTVTDLWGAVLRTADGRVGVGRPAP
jgi:glycosyltransferase involved in cell wall biosynthesis